MKYLILFLVVIGGLVYYLLTDSGYLSGAITAIALCEKGASTKVEQETGGRILKRVACKE